MKNGCVLKVIDSVCESNLENKRLGGSLPLSHKYDVLTLEAVILF